MRTKEEIDQEILNLNPIARDFDTELQSDSTCIAAGAHDALRWVMGLSEESISEKLKAR